MSDAPAAPAAPSTPAPTSAPAATADKGAAPTSTIPEATPAVPSKRKFVGKIDGAEKAWELSDEEVAVRLQKSEAAEKRFQEGAALRKQGEAIQAQFQEFKKLALEDPAAVLRALGVEDPHAAAEKLVESKWKRDVMPEHERKLAEAQEKLAAAEKWKSDQLAKEESAKTTAAQKQLETKIEADFKRAFEVSGLPWDPDHLEQFGKVALEALDYGIDITPEQMAAEVKSRLETKSTETESKLKTQVLSRKGDELLTWLGDDVVKEVLRAAVSKHKASLEPAAVGGATRTTPPQGGATIQSGKKFYTPEDWRKAFKT